jgi:hypothetical protein
MIEDLEGHRPMLDFLDPVPAQQIEHARIGLGRVEARAV